MQYRAPRVYERVTRRLAARLKFDREIDMGDERRRTLAPVWMIEGGEQEATLPHGEDRRLSALAEAIREHESAGRRHAMPARPQDLTLYRRLRRICSEVPSREGRDS
jgi:hypothetical protein